MPCPYPPPPPSPTGGEGATTLPLDGGGAGRGCHAERNEASAQRAKHLQKPVFSQGTDLDTTIFALQKLALYTIWTMEVGYIR